MLIYLINDPLHYYNTFANYEVELDQGWVNQVTMHLKYGRISAMLSAIPAETKGSGILILHHDKDSNHSLIRCAINLLNRVSRVCTHLYIGRVATTIDEAKVLGE